jgi:hypothetical protein
MLEFSEDEHLPVLRMLQSMRGRVEDPRLLEKLVDQHLVRMHDVGVSLPPDITEETRERLGISSTEVGTRPSWRQFVVGSSRHNWAFSSAARVGFQAANRARSARSRRAGFQNSASGADLRL